MSLRWVDWRAIGAAFLVAGAVPGPLGGHDAHAQARNDKVYTVANYPVDATADDAVTAKDRALADGQQAALRSLLKRLVPVTAYPKLKNLRALKAGDFVDGVSVLSERNSSTQYIATLDFTFSPQSVRSLLRREGLPFVDSQATQTVVVPLVRAGQAIEGPDSASSKLWMEAWTGLDLDHSLTPIRLGRPRAAPSPDAVKKLLAGDMVGLQPFASEFRSDDTVVAIAEPDPAARKVHIWLAGNDPAGPILLKRSYRMGGDMGYTLELAAVVGLGVIEGRWKAQTSGGGATDSLQSGTGESFEIAVEFRSSGQWEEMRSRLQRIDRVEDVDVVSMTTRRAVLALRYPGGADRLAAVVGEQGMGLIRAGESWTLRPLP